MEDVDDIKVLQTQVASTFSSAIEKRQQINGHLQTAIAANDESLKKLRSLAEKKHLPTNKIGSRFVIKKIEEVLQQAKEEVTIAEKEWNDLSGSIKKLVIFFGLYILLNLTLNTI